MATRRGKTKELVHYHKDGTIWAKGHMAEGVMTGYWEWFRKDGSLKRSGYFENGAQTGEWTTYDQNGKIVTRVASVTCRHCLSPWSTHWPVQQAGPFSARCHWPLSASTPADRPHSTFTVSRPATPRGRLPSP